MASNEEPTYLVEVRVTEEYRVTITVDEAVNILAEQGFTVPPREDGMNDTDYLGMLVRDWDLGAALDEAELLVPDTIVRAHFIRGSRICRYVRSTSVVGTAE